MHIDSVFEVWHKYCLSRRPLMALRGQLYLWALRRRYGFRVRTAIRLHRWYSLVGLYRSSLVVVIDEGGLYMRRRYK